MHLILYNVKSYSEKDSWPSSLVILATGKNHDVVRNRKSCTECQTSIIAPSFTHSLEYYAKDIKKKYFVSMATDSEKISGSQRSGNASYQISVICRVSLNSKVLLNREKTEKIVAM